MRRLIGSALCLCLSLGLAMAQDATQIPPAPSPQTPPSIVDGLAGRQAPMTSGPMTWGNVLSRNFLPSGSQGAAVAEPSSAPVSLLAEEDGDIVPALPVIELFTSQGCAACPSADAIFGKYAQDPGVVALALHVDYWDYIGWADEFANHDHTRRQKAYARSVGSRMIYTPQVIVGGREQISGNDSPRLEAAIHRATEAQSPLSFRMTQSGDKRRLTAAAPPGTPEITVQLVRFLPESTVEIERGENAGKTVTYHNIVTGWETLTRWDTRQPLRLDVSHLGQGHAAILFQEAGPGAILGAIRLD